MLVGEMRDMETIETALHAAETGHLVFSTLHTLDATETINRIISVFPPHQQKQIRLQLAVVLKAAIAMRLVPRADGLGRVAAMEVLVATPFIKDCIIDKEKTHLIPPRLPRARRIRHADLRSVDLRPLLARAHHLRRGAALGLERGRVQAKVQGISTTADQARDQMASTLFGKPAASAGDTRNHAVREVATAPTPTPRRWLLLGQRELSRRAAPRPAAPPRLPPEAVDEALSRLSSDRTLDDQRVARAAARVEARIRGRGRRGSARSSTPSASRDIAMRRSRTSCRSRRKGPHRAGAANGGCAARPWPTWTTAPAPAIVRGLVGQGFALSAVLKKVDREVLAVSGLGLEEPIDAPDSR